MTFDEIILAVTSNAAKSLALEKRIGALKPSYAADIVLLDVPNPEYLIYHPGRNHVWKVIKNGKLKHENTRNAVFLN